MCAHTHFYTTITPVPEILYAPLLVTQLQLHWSPLDCEGSLDIEGYTHVSEISWISTLTATGM